MILTKASRQAISALAQMAEVLGNAHSQHVTAAPMTCMLCPSLTAAMERTLSCLQALPVMMDRTVQLGKESEFCFEASIWLQVACFVNSCGSVVLLRALPV